MKSIFRLNFMIAVILAFAVCSSLLGCNQSPLDPDRSYLGNPIVKLVISPEDATMITGQYRQYAVNAVDANGKYSQVRVNWSCTYGKINSDGEYTAPDQPGYGLITAKYQSITATTQVYVVTSGDIVKFYLVPESGEIEVGRSVLFTCMAQNAGGEFIRTNAAWSCDNGNITNFGYYSAPGSPMSAAITARQGKWEATAHVQVTTHTPASVVIFPQTAEVAARGTQQFTATVYDRYGNLLDSLKKNVVWSTTYGTMDSDGVYICPDIPGAAIVMASVFNTTGRAYVNTTSSSTARSLAISPPNAIVAMGNSVRFTARAYDQNGNEVALPGNVVWTTNNGNITTDGLFSATAPVAAGVTTVTAYSGFLSAQVTVIVTN